MSTRGAVIDEKPYSACFLLLLRCLLIAGSGLAGCEKTAGRPAGTTATPESPGLEEEPPLPADQKDTGSTTTAPAAELSGIEVVGVRLSAAGYMLDFRYRVKDPEKASSLMARRVRPRLIDEKTGATLSVPNPPKVGPLRQRSEEPIVNRHYWVMFANPGRRIKAGDSVTAIIGDCRIEKLIVQ